jgi:hypothetical protein
MQTTPQIDQRTVNGADIGRYAHFMPLTYFRSIADSYQRSSVVTAALLNLPSGERRGYNVRTAEIAHAS